MGRAVLPGGHVARRGAAHPVRLPVSGRAGRRPARGPFDPQEVARRRAQWGPNRMPRVPGRGVWRRIAGLCVPVAAPAVSCPFPLRERPRRCTAHGAASRG
ncbi:cation-transporting P-type ATPase [Streptomyces angustmyceticus]|uniref:cation-transporting P-type ATPase n=1 Tax=Streptomyces angustmyceticus TaxID=285578 RepID=UPI00344D4621